MPRRPIDRVQGQFYSLFKLGARWRRSLQPHPESFTPRKNPVPILQEARWAPGPFLTCTEIFTNTGFRYPDRPARSVSLYRLNYPGPLYVGTLSVTHTPPGCLPHTQGFFLFFPLNQQSEYKVFYKLMYWLSGSLTCRLPNVMRSPPARRSLVSSITVD